MKGGIRPMDDREIIKLFYERSEQAITELVIKYGSAVKNVAWNILNNPQDVEEYLKEYQEPTILICRLGKSLTKMNM